MKIVITDHGFPSIDQERTLFAAAGHELVVAQCKVPADLIPFCRDADALLVQWAVIDRGLIAALDRCKVIVRYGIGVDSVDLQAAGERRIPVCNVPDYCIDEVADHALALALSLGRQIPQTDAVVRQGTWKITPPTPFAAFRDTLFATAGFGRIARAVLARAKAFGFRLGAYDPYVDAAVFAAAGVRRLDAAELLREAGILSLHLPLGDQTRHFLNRDSLATMRKDAIIVNTARGGLIDTNALAEALTQRALGGAGLDVFETEPLPADHPIRQAPNVLLTSHTAWYSGGSVPELQRRSAEAVLQGLRGGATLANVVNQRYFPPPLNPMKFVDLSHPLVHGQANFPMDPKLSIVTHSTTQTLKYAMTQVSMATHQGTHLDAMSHFVDGGKTIDQMPLEWFFGDAILLRLPKAACEEITTADFQKIEPLLQPGVRLIYETGWHRQFGQANYFSDYPSLTQDAARYLVSRKIRMLGMDTPTPSRDWYEVHHILLADSAEVVVVEGLTNLSQLPERFTFAGFPLNFQGRDGSPIRAVAILP